MASDPAHIVDTDTITREEVLAEARVAVAAAAAAVEEEAAVVAVEAAVAVAVESTHQRKGYPVLVCMMVYGIFYDYLMETIE